MANLSRVRVNGNMVDPFCGSGTVLIESALYALNIAPGLRRNFSAENWDQIDASVWRKEKERAQDLIRRDARFQGRGFDIDGAAVSLTIANAKKAGVIGCIQAEKRDIRDLSFVIRHMESVCWISNRQKNYIKLWDKYLSQNMVGVIPLLLPMKCLNSVMEEKRIKEENCIMA